MGNETELKFEASPQDLKRLKTSQLLHRRMGKPVKEENLISVYFDTDKRELKRNGLSLRVRHLGDKRVQTIKTQGAGGPFIRGEWEHKIKSGVPDLRAARGTALAPILIKKVKRSLKPIFETRVHRTTVPWRKNGSRIEVVFDEGKIRAGQKSAQINEVELELKRGKALDLFKTARLFRKHVPIKLALRTKSERGYDLTSDNAALSSRAERIELQRNTSTAEAFRIIGRSVLRHVVANAAAVQTADPEGVHQMRVGLRRLRTLTWLFKELIGGEQTERIKAEIKWLTGELGPARDLDVYVRSTIEPSKGTVSPRQGVQELASELAARRATAFANAKRAIASPRYQRFAFETFEWIEIGNWAKHSDSAGGRAVKRFAKDILTQRTTKVMKKGKKLQKLNPGQRHKLRIALKKLRYTTEFFESLFKGSTAAKHRLEFVGHLKDLQDGLGALNDIAVHQQMATRLAGHKKKPAPAFAAGVVSGREQSEIEPLLKGAHTAARKFAHARRFWS